MSYQVLARKWRPASFETLVGQNHVLKALISALNNQRLHHAYLFTGTRGVGKTTIARIFAKCLNCEQGVSAKPCGKCGVCSEISDGRFVDLIEIDAASRTKVEDTREILDNVQYAPVRGRFKIYLIDEVHMLSTHSFNALLKTLEEPPDHVKFLLATTDPQKLPITILSRCLQFHLKNMPKQQIVDHLANILTQESIPFEFSALWQLAQAADGSMRDALSLTDQAIAFCDTNITEKGTSDLLGTISHQYLLSLLETLVDNNAENLLKITSKLAEQTVDFASTLDNILTILHKIAILQKVPNTIDSYPSDKKSLIQLSKKISAEDVQLFYQIGITSKKDLALAPDSQTGFEMTLLRMMTFRPVDVTTHEPQIDSKTSSNQSTQSYIDNQTNCTAQNSKKILSSENRWSNSLIPSTPSDHTNNSHENKTLLQNTVIEQASTTDQIVDNKKQFDATAQTFNEQQTGNNEATQLPPWHILLPQLGLTGVAGALAAHSILEQDASSKKVTLTLDNNYDILLDSTHKNRIEKALSHYLKQSVNISLKTGELKGKETPVMIKEQEAANKLQTARENITRDPQVQLLVETFKAQLIHQSICPL